jgi:hypothetical protein
MTYIKDARYAINLEYQGRFIRKNLEGVFERFWYVPQGSNTAEIIASVEYIEAEIGDIIVKTYEHPRSSYEHYLHLRYDSVDLHTLIWLKNVSYGEAFKNPNNQGVLTTIQNYHTLLNNLTN